MSENPGPSELENVEWKLIELERLAIQPSQRGAPTMTLSSKEQRAQGFAGCNRFSADYELDGEKLNFTGFALTQMGCLQPTPEPSLIKALGAAASWKIDGHTLELFDASGSLRARWTVTVIESGGQS